MAYRFPNSGTLEIDAEGHSRARAAVIVSGLGVTLALIWVATHPSVWSVGLAALASASVIMTGRRYVGRRTGWEITHGGVRRLGVGGENLDGARVERVRVDLLPGSGIDTGLTENARHEYVVDLVWVANDRLEQLRAFSSTSESTTRQAAEAIALHMTWPMEDAIGDEAELREADALELRAERKPEPTEPPPEGIRSERHAGESSLVVDGLMSKKNRGRLPTFAVAASSLTGAGVAGTILFSPVSIGATTLVAGFAGAIGCVAVAFGIEAGLSRARARLTVRQGVLYREVHLGPVCLQTSQLDLRRVERVRVQTRTPAPHGCVLVCPETTMRLGPALDSPALRWLEMWIASRLP